MSLLSADSGAKVLSGQEHEPQQVTKAGGFCTLCDRSVQQPELKAHASQSMHFGNMSNYFCVTSCQYLQDQPKLPSKPASHNSRCLQNQSLVMAMGRIQNCLHQRATVMIQTMLAAFLQSQPCPKRLMVFTAASLVHLHLARLPWIVPKCKLEKQHRAQGQ